MISFFPIEEERVCVEPLIEINILGLLFSAKVFIKPEKVIKVTG